MPFPIEAYLIFNFAKTQKRGDWFWGLPRDELRSHRQTHVTPKQLINGLFMRVTGVGGRYWSICGVIHQCISGPEERFAQWIRVNCGPATTVFTCFTHLDRSKGRQRRAISRVWEPRPCQSWRGVMAAGESRSPGTSSGEVLSDRLLIWKVGKRQGNEYTAGRWRFQQGY